VGYRHAAGFPGWSGFRFLQQSATAAPLALLFLAWFFGSVASLSAATVGTPAVNPSSIPLGVSTPVAVTVKVTDPTLIAGGVNLLLVDASGGALANLGAMHDDGLNGDAVAGDGVFTLRYSFQQATAGPIYLQASAAFKGALLRVRSGVINLNAAAGPLISDFNPKSAPAGTLVTVTGSNFVPSAGVFPTVTLSQQGGGSVTAPLMSSNTGSLAFAVPTNATTGPVVVAVAGQSATSTTPLTVGASATFSLSALPGTANLTQGQSVSIAVQLSSAGGFTGLAPLAVSGVPTNIAAVFTPPQITAGQTSILMLAAPVGQPLGQASLSITASATTNGVAQSQSAAVQLTVRAPTTSLIGRAVVSNATETSLVGVTVKMLGLDGNGNTTGCSGSGISDAAGNFALTNLSTSCVGPQLAGFDGTTVTSPAGKYAGVNLVYTLASGQVTASPVLVHLPRIDNQETFLVHQNYGSDQSYSYTTVPNLSVTVYAGTTFTMPVGTTPDPFPLVAIQVPIDRLPDYKAPTSTMVSAFIVAFQPANATTSQPVAVYFPNTLSTAPGTDVPLMTLDPTHGKMVPYGTGVVSANGLQIIPDADPSHPGHLYGLVHFDWHGPMPPPPNQPNPPLKCVGPACKDAGPADCCGPGNGDPVDPSSGIQVIQHIDISISGPRGSIFVERTYRSLTSLAGAFGAGGSHNYNYGIDTAFLYFNNAASAHLIMPDGNRVLFSVQSCPASAPCPGLRNVTNAAMLGAVMTANSDNSVDLRWKDGTLYHFVPISFQLGSLLASIQDPNGNTITIARDPALPANINTVTDPVGRSLTFAYDSSGHITSITDPIGRTVQYTYDTSGGLSSFTDLNGGVTRYTYDGSHNLLTVTDPRGILQAQNKLDLYNRVVEQDRPDGGVLSFTYLSPACPEVLVFEDDFGNVLPSPIVKRICPPAFLYQVIAGAIVTDSRGVQQTYRYDYGTGVPSDITSALGETRHLYYTAGTNLVTLITEDPTASSFSYDSIGNVLSATDATLQTTTFTYEPVFNKLTSTTDPLGHVTAFTYDTSGNLLSATDANGNVSSYQYNSNGLPTQSTDALNQTTKFTYDSSGNLASVTDPLGNKTSFAYDAISRLLAVIDPLRRKTSFTYDALGRVLTRTDAKNGVTSLTYDADGNVLTVTDAKRNKTSFTYDPMNRLLTRTDPLGRTDTRTYDISGNLTRFVDRRGKISTFDYDTINHLVGETYQDATVTRSYDILGRLVQVVDSASGTFSFSYDLAGRLLSSVSPNGTVNYAYDGRGAMVSRQVVGQPALTYTYDAAGNLTSAALPQASAAITYDAKDRPSAMTRLNGVSTALAYDAAGRLLSLTHAKGSSALDTEAYTYDAVGNRIAHSTSIGQSLMTQPVASASYDANSQQTQFGSTSNTFDANGNLTSGLSTFTWDGRNRLQSIVTAAGQTTSFTYDFAGSLIGQTDAGPNLNLSKQFVLDNLTNVAYEVASDGTSYSVLGGRSIDSHWAIAQANTQVLYGLPDAVSSTILAVDQSGAVAGSTMYEPFGQGSTAGTVFPFQFTGRQQATPRFQYSRARFYDPLTGRFLSEDSAGQSGAFSTYSYANNDPIDLVDPLGRWSSCPALSPVQNYLKDQVASSVAGAATNRALGEPQNLSDRVLSASLNGALTALATTALTSAWLFAHAALPELLIADIAVEAFAAAAASGNKQLFLEAIGIPEPGKWAAAKASAAADSANNYVNSAFRQYAFGGGFP
jgi:RHS repeat-associated protein